MKKQYHRALVIGKFQPLHKGHLALIDFAKEQADYVTVCVLAHDGELIPLEQRVEWVKKSFYLNNEISVGGYSYDPKILTESSESDLKSSHEWAEYLCEVCEDFSEVDVIVGSEQYVKYMADYVGIHHLVYDEKREMLRISATDIKSDVLRYWDYLSPAVKQGYVKHICICGSESTGKSTTCKRLEEDYDFVTMIPEIGRCLVGKSEICEVKTLQKILEIHYSLLEAIKNDPPTPIMLWDTDNITTMSYYSFLFPGKAPNEILQNKELLKADKYFFFESNIPYHSDATRLEQDSAWELRNHHLKTYFEFGISPQLVSSDERCEIVRHYILDQIENIRTIFVK